MVEWFFDNINIMFLSGYLLGCLTILMGLGILKLFCDSKQNHYKRGSRSRPYPLPTYLPQTPSSHIKSRNNVKEAHKGKDIGSSGRTYEPDSTDMNRRTTEKISIAGSSNSSSNDLLHDHFRNEERSSNTTPEGYDPSSQRDPDSSRSVFYMPSVSMSFASKLVEDYNRAVQNEDIGGFRTTYGAQLKRIGPEGDSSNNITFVEKNDGDYYAIQDTESAKHLVFPRLGISFRDFHFGPGKMGEVYKCHGFDPMLSYEKVKVEFPAEFNLEGGSQYVFYDQGRLSLGKGIPL